MRSVRRSTFAVALGLGALGAGPAHATTPPTDTSTPTTTVTSVPAADAAAGAVPIGPTPPRGGSAAGGLVHDGGATDYDVRELATTALLTVLALAVAGHLYGRMQSTVPDAGRRTADAAPPPA